MVTVAIRRVMKRTTCVSWAAPLLLLASSACSRHSSHPVAAVSPSTAAAGNAGQSTVSAGIAANPSACGTGSTPCDPTNLAGASCTSVMGRDGQLLCDPVTCLFETSMCSPMITNTGGLGGLLGRGAAGQSAAGAAGTGSAALGGSVVAGGSSAAGASGAGVARAAGVLAGVSGAGGRSGN
jgi:hypothetical protein